MRGLVYNDTVKLNLRAAVQGNVDVLVTGDKDFLESGITYPRIMTAQEFLGE